VDKRHAWGVVYDEGDINGYFGDFDNDGDLDLVIGSLYPGHYDKLYRNEGDHFTDVTYEAGVAIHQGQNVAWADLNEDGALDLVVHFGLAKNTTIDSLKVRWVQGTVANAAPEETISGAAPNGIWKIVQGTGTATKLK